jgi:bifunctional non-homologous end joining protein LigD
MPVPRVQPIAPTWRNEPFDHPDWSFEFKYDGFRALCYVEQRRNGNIMTRFDELAEQVAGVLDVDDAILDGEIIAADDTGRPQFYELLRGTRSPCYVAFDLLWLNGVDLRSLPLSERRQALQAVLPKGSAILSEALSIEGRGCELFELMCTNDLEGIVADDAYDPGVRWLKIKSRDYTQKEGRGDLFERSNGRPWWRER